MARGIPVTLNNGRHWNTKNEASAHFKSMLARYEIGQQVDPDDAGDLAALLARYDQCLNPGELTKIGCGISHFTKQLNVGDGYASKGFHVHRTDGTAIDFSYVDAIRFDPGA